MKPWRIALAYVALSVLALALFATPLWYAWRMNVGTLRVFVPEDMQALPALFHREGADAVAAVVRARSDPSGKEVIVFAGPGKKVLAGTLRRWPTEIPDAPGTYGHVIDRGDGTLMRIVVSHELLPGGYQLIMGRQSAGLMSLEGHFWYGIAGAMTIVLALGGALAWLLARRASAARLSEERYRRALQATNDGIWEWNPTTDEIFLSERARRLWAVPDGVPIRTRADLIRAGGFHPDDFQRTEDVIKPNLGASSGSFDMEYRIVDANGEVRWVRSQGRTFPGTDDPRTLVTGSLTDVTESKDAEDALRASEERYSRAMAAADAGFWDWDVTKDEFHASPRLLKMVGFPPGTTFAGRADFMARAPFHRQDRDRYLQAVKALFASPDSRLSRELRVIIDGVTHWQRLEGMCFRDAAGNVVRWTGSATDVTDRKLAEEALRASEERYALAVAGSNDGIWDWDLLTNKMFVSERAQRVFGLEPGPTERLREEWHALIAFHPLDHAAQRRMVDEYLSGTGNSNEGEWRLQDKDGGYRWIRIRSICLRNAAGEPVRMAGSVSDIDAQRKAEDALRASQERYALAVAGSDDGVWDVDFAAQRVFISARARELAGMPPGPEVVRLDEWFASLPLHPEDATVRAEAFAAHIAGKTPAYAGEFRLRQPDGTYRWRRLRGLCVRDADGKPYRMAGSISDVDARRRAEDELRESESRFRSLTQISSDWYWRQDENLRFTYLSEGVSGRAGWPGEDYIGRLRWEVPDIHLISGSWEEHKAVLAKRQPFRDLEYWRPGKDGPVYTSISGAPIFGEDGRFEGYQGVGRNITEGKRFQEALRLSEERHALAMRASGAGHWDWKIATDEFYASPRYLEFAGFPSDIQYSRRADIVPRIPFHPEDRAKYEAEVAAHFAGETPSVDMVIRVMPRGETRWLHVIGTCLRDAHGKPVRWAGSVTDITARKLAEEARQLSEERYALALEVAEDGHFDWNVQADTIFASARCLRILGIPLGEYRSWSQALAYVHFHPDDAERIKNQWRTALTDRSTDHEFEYRILRRDKPRWIRSRWKIFRDLEGMALRVVGVVADITERTRVEDALRVSEARYARAMDASADGLWEWNAASDELFISPRARDLWGIPDEVEIRTRAQLKAQNLQFTEDTIRECVAQRSNVEMTYSVVNPAGEFRWVRSMGKVFLDGRGEPMLVTGSLTDVTERKLAADALRLSEEELRARQDMLDLAQKAARAVAFEWHIGPGEGENRWSPDLEVMYGLDPGTYDGTYKTWKKLVFPADRPAAKAAIGRAEETGDVAVEYRVVHPNGAVRWLEAKGRMFFDAARKPTRVVGFMLDVTDRHQAEEELHRLERQLRQAQRLEAMGTLAGGIAHDFNNILGAILGYGEMAMRDAPKGSRLARDLDSIIVAGERGRALVDRVLAFSRSGVGERVPVHVEKVVREALDLLSANLPRSVALRAKLRAGRAAMLGDATQVHQVIMNLATNAIQAMPGGGKLRVSLAATRLERARVPTIGIIDPGEYLVLEVADTGAGIRPDVLERIFDPFFTTKEAGTGTGLGLSLVHGIVAELGGAIDVVSTPGAGSTFTVYLPRSGETVDAPQGEEPEMLRGDGQRVLVVDDEEPLVRLATRTLEELGYAPVGFTSSSAALAAFRADPQRFDALITDERMPGMSGSALIREVRGIRSTMPVVLMSGYLGAVKPRESGLPEVPGRAPKMAAAIGADEVLQKPLSARDLATSLAKVLRL